MRASDSFEVIDHPDVFQVKPRHRRPCTDDVVVSIFHRTTGGGRSAVLTREQAIGLHEWLGRWVAEGWDGVPRA